MNRTIVIAIVSMMLSAGSVAGNPIMIPNLPLISEVQMTDSIHWEIELDGKIAIFNRGFYQPGYQVLYVHPPCSVNFLRFRIASSKKIYTFKTYFDTSAIFVLTRASITGIPQSEDVAIHANDTIQILDTTWADTNATIWNSSSMIIRPVKPGNSLVNLWYGRISPVETTRPSMGSRGNYTTVYNLFLRDSLNNVPSKVYVHSLGYSSSYDAYLVESIGNRLADPSVYSVMVSLLNSSEWRGFLCDSVVQYGIPPNYFPGTKWSANYVDTVFSVNDTIILPCPTAGIINAKPINSPPAVRFSALPHSGGGILFVIAAPYHVQNAAVQIYDMSGRRLASVDVPAISSIGTYSFVWDGAKENSRKISAGTYLCKLAVDGAAAASQTVTVR